MIESEKKEKRENWIKGGKSWFLNNNLKLFNQLSTFNVISGIKIIFYK